MSLFRRTPLRGQTSPMVAVATNVSLCSANDTIRVKECQRTFSDFSVRLTNCPAVCFVLFFLEEPSRHSSAQGKCWHWKCCMADFWIAALTVQAKTFIVLYFWQHCCFSWGDHTVWRHRLSPEVYTISLTFFSSSVSLAMAVHFPPLHLPPNVAHWERSLSNEIVVGCCWTVNSTRGLFSVLDRAAGSVVPWSQLHSTDTTMTMSQSGLGQWFL